VWTLLLSSEIVNAFQSPIHSVHHQTSLSGLRALQKNEDFIISSHNSFPFENNSSSGIDGKRNNNDWKKLVSNLVATGTVLASIVTVPLTANAGVELSSGALTIQTTKQDGQSLVKTEIDTKEFLSSLFKNRKDLISSLKRIADAVKDELNQPAWIEIEKEILQIEGDVAPDFKINPPSDVQQTIRDLSQGRLNIILNGEIINLSVDDSFSATEDEIVIRAKGVKGIPLSGFPESPKTVIKSNIQKQMEAVDNFWNSPLPFAKEMTQKVESNYGFKITSGNTLLGSTFAFIGGSYAVSYNYYITQLENAQKEAEEKRANAAEKKKKDAAKKKKIIKPKKEEEEQKETTTVKVEKIEETEKQVTETIVQTEEKSVDEDFELIQRLINTVPSNDRTTLFGKVYTNCFSGKEAVESFCETFDTVKSKEEAIEFGQTLCGKKILSPVKDRTDFVFEDSPSKYYRLQPFHTPYVLNSFRIWPSSEQSTSPMIVLKNVERIFDSMESKATDESTGMMDYVAITSDPDYPKFESAICELQTTKIEGMDDETKLAFGIGVYNLMIKYAFVKVGIPKTTIQRLGFFDKVSFNIGGDIYSFNDLENGILRANSKAPVALSFPFSKEDSRLNYIVKNFDPRIHFALNCGAKSCPPVKPYTVENIEKELQGTTFEFTDNDENVFVDEEKNELKLTMILNWFSSDFAPSKDQIPESILPFLRDGSTKKEILQRMIRKNSTIKVNFFEYDWSTNASNFKQFDTKRLTSNYFSLRAILKKPFS